MILGALFDNSLENPSTPISEYEYDGVWGSLPYRESASGVRVTRQSALTLPAFWRGVDLISDLIGKLPLYTYRQVGKGKEPAIDHVIYNLLMYSPNSETTAIRFRKTMEGHRLTAGNGYAHILRNGDGSPRSLHHLDPENTWPVRVGGVLGFITRVQQELIPMAATDVLHIAGMGFDGLVGYSVIRIASQALGLGLATNEFAARYFRNNSEPRVIIEVPGSMPQAAQTEFLRQWDSIHQGLSNAHKTAIITNGGKVAKVSINAQESQLIEQKKFSLIDMANTLGLPPHKLGDSSRTAYNSLEQENQSMLDDCVEARLIGWEQELRNKLLTERQKRENTHLIRFDRNALVRPTLNDLANYYSRALAGVPWMKIEEVRHERDLNPIDVAEIFMPASVKGQGDKKLDVQQTSDAQNPPVDPAVTRNAHLALVVRSCRKMAERIAKNSQRLGKSPKEFMAWIDDIADHSRAVMVDEFRAPLAACETIFVVSDSPEALADKIIERASTELLALAGGVTAERLPDAIEEWSRGFIGHGMKQIASGLFQQLSKAA